MVTIFHKFFLHGGKNQIYELDIFTMIKNQPTQLQTHWNTIWYVMNNDIKLSCILFGGIDPTSGSRVTCNQKPTYFDILRVEFLKNDPRVSAKGVLLSLFQVFSKI